MVVLGDSFTEQVEPMPSARNASGVVSHLQAYCCLQIRYLGPGGGWYRFCQSGSLAGGTNFVGR